MSSPLDAVIELYVFIVPHTVLVNWKQELLEARNTKIFDGCWQSVKSRRVSLPVLVLCAEIDQPPSDISSEKNFPKVYSIEFRQLDDGNTWYYLDHKEQ